MGGDERLGDFSGQIRNVMGDEVSQLAICGMPQGVIHDIALGSVCG
jgi:hypothetical protein